MRSQAAIGRSGGWWLSSRLWVGLALAMMLVAVPASLMAEEHGSTEGQHEVAAGEEHGSTGEEHEGGEEHHLHKHHFSVFLGATEAPEEHSGEHDGEGNIDPHSEGSSSSKDDPNFTLGFDYERRFTQLYGFGGMFDWVVEGDESFLLGPIAFLHPFGGAKLFAAPCWERVRDTGEDEFVFRVGASWDFEVGKFTVGPDLIYDFSSEHDLWVVGLAIGRGW